MRLRREHREMSRAELAREAGLSVRFLAELEGGVGNISVGRLAEVATALGTTASALLAAAEGPFARAPGVVALLGLRGAGKSTLGPLVAERLDAPFVELDQLIEQSAGMPLAQVFELHGEGYYRRLERDVLRGFLEQGGRAVIATGGGIVTEAESFDVLRRSAITVWLRARSVDHWERVLAQGDRRPMANRARAMDELESLLRERAELYARADFVVDTSDTDPDTAVARIVRGVAQRWEGADVVPQLDLPPTRS